MSTIAKATLSDAERRVLDRLLAVLRERLGDELDAVWLYGSRARGEPPHEDSDVDVLVLVRGSESDHSSGVQRIVWETAEAEDVSPFTFSIRVRDRDWLEGRRAIESFFIQEVDRDKIVLHGEP